MGFKFLAFLACLVMSLLMGIFALVMTTPNENPEVGISILLAAIWFSLLALVFKE